MRTKTVLKIVTFSPTENLAGIILGWWKIIQNKGSRGLFHNLLYFRLYSLY